MIKVNKKWSVDGRPEPTPQPSGGVSYRDIHPIECRVEDSLFNIIGGVIAGGLGLLIAFAIVFFASL